MLRQVQAHQAELFVVQVRARRQVQLHRWLLKVSGGFCYGSDFSSAFSCNCIAVKW